MSVTSSYDFFFGTQEEREAAPCDCCAGRGFQLDWTDQGGAMRAVPGDTCRKCDGSGQAKRPRSTVAPVNDGELEP